MITRKKWTKEQEEFLAEKWGKYSLPDLAKRLKRTPNAVELKARKLRLECTKLSQGLLTAQDLADAVKVCPHTVIEWWIRRYGLPAKKRVTRRSRQFWQIDITDFWKWAKQNQDKFDSRRIEPLVLGFEPEWMVEKRKADRLIPKRHFAIWTPIEDQMLINMLNKKMSYEDMSKELGRTRAAVSNRIQELKRLRKIV